MKAIERIICLTAASLSLAACGKTIDWKQEVKLHDGRVIVVDRKSKQESMSIPTKGILEPWQQIAFTHPASRERIVWDLPKGLGLWMLDIGGGMIWTVLKPQSIADYNAWGCPSPPWIVFRWQTGIWQQVAMGDLPSVLTTPNTLAAAASDNPRSENKLVSVEQFGAYLARLDPEYRTISREKVNPIALGCHESVLHKQGRQSEIDNRR